MRKEIFFCEILVLLLTFLCVAVYADQDVINKDSQGIALKNYDTVAYFSQGKALEGNKDFEHKWMGATWRFSSGENRDLFVANPEKYAPEFGGYCAYGVTKGYLAPIDPKAWKIVNGRLYLNYNLETQKVWLKDQADNIATGIKLWPKAKTTKPLQE